MAHFPGRLREAPFRRLPAVLDTIKAGQPNVYTLRDPRQVGKTTLLKQFAARLVHEEGWHPRRVVYYSLDLFQRPAQIVDLVQRVKSAFPVLPGSEGAQSAAADRWCFLLDEVSSLPNWQRGIKYLRDNTSAANDCFVLTGSSALDIRCGGERLPSRRGPGTDLEKLLLPLSFPEFLTATQPMLLPSHRLTLPDFLIPDVASTLHETMLSFDALEQALEDYAATGGFPLAVADRINTGAVAARRIADLWDIVAGDVDCWGRKRLDALRLLGRAVRSLGSPLDWHSLSVDMGVSQPTDEAYAPSWPTLSCCSLSISESRTAR